jgi:hypothetical protein
MPAYACSFCKGTFVGDGPVPVCPNGKAMHLLPNPKVGMAATGCRRTKARFLEESFAHDPFVPSTRRGKFEAKYAPRSGHLNITVRLNAEFEASWTEFFGPLEKSRLKASFVEAVPRYWNGHCQLHCTRHGWTDINVAPRFAIDFQDTSSHFRMVMTRESALARGNPHGRECRGFVSLNQVTGVAGKDRLEVRDFQVSDFNHKLVGTTTAANDRTALETALRNSGGVVTLVATQPVVTLTFADGSDDAAGFQAVLAQFVTAANRQLKGSHPIPVLVKGFAKATEAGALAGTRATAVNTALTGLLLKNPVTIEAPGAGKAAVEVKIDRDYEDSFERDERVFAYNVAAHEYGHMVGLPDEYENPQGDAADVNTRAKAIVKTGFLALVGEVGLVPPVFPSHTSSMMSDGMTPMVWHYVTAWQALTYLTSQYLAPDEWEILSI